MSKPELSAPFPQGLAPNAARNARLLEADLALYRFDFGASFEVIGYGEWKTDESGDHWSKAVKARSWKPDLTGGRSEMQFFDLKFNVAFAASASATVTSVWARDHMERLIGERDAASHGGLVEAFVQEMLVRFFEIMPTRKAVLNHTLFDVGTGLCWYTPRNAADDYAVIGQHLGYDEPLPDRIDRDHLAEQLVLDHHKRGHIASAAAQRANAEFQHMVREWANRHLGVISSPDFHFNGIGLRTDLPTGVWTSRSLLAAMPDNAHPQWKEAIRRHCDDVLIDINSRYALRDERDKNIENLKRECPALAAPYELAMETLERLRDPVREQARAELAKRLVDGLDANVSRAPSPSLDELFGPLEDAQPSGDRPGQ